MTRERDALELASLALEQHKRTNFQDYQCACIYCETARTLIDTSAKLERVRVALQASYDYFQGPHACGSFTCNCGTCGLCEFRIETARALADIGPSHKNSEAVELKPITLKGPKQYAPRVKATNKYMTNTQQNHLTPTEHTK